MITLSKELVRKGACREGREWATQFKTRSEAWKACTDPQWLLWALRVSKLITKRQAVKLAVTFASHVKQTTKEGKEALACAKRWLAEPTEENRLACQKAASRAAADAADAADAAWAWAADANAADAADAAWAAASAAAWAAADERKWQVRQIKKMFPDPWSGK